MKIKKPDAQTIMAFRVTPGRRRLVQRLTAALSEWDGARWTYTDVIEEALLTLAKRLKVPVEDGK